MATKKITKRSVDALRCPPAADRIFLWDDKLSGFGVCAYPSKDSAKARKVYVAQFRLKGRSRRMKIGEHGRMTAIEARKTAKKILGAVEDNKDPIEERRLERGVRTFKDVAEEFMKVHAPAKCKPRTVVEYRRLLDNRLLAALGSKQVTAIKRVDVARFHAGMSDAPGLANRALSLFSSIWNWAANRDEVPKHANPASGLERNPEKGRERYLTGDELGRLGETLRLAETEGLPWVVDEDKPTSKHVPKKERRTRLDPSAVAAIRLLILTGARLREILDLRWDYVDWERALLLLPDSKTGRKTIYLSAPALAVLQGLHRTKRNPFIIPGAGPRKPKPGKKSGAQARADLKNPWAAVSRAAGLEGVRLHDLRHSFAATGAGASLGLPMIGKLLGHTQPVTTQRYAHLDADPMHRAANLIGDQLAAAMERKTADVIDIAGRTKPVGRNRRL